MLKSIDHSVKKCDYHQKKYKLISCLKKLTNFKNSNWKLIEVFSTIHSILSYILPFDFTRNKMLCFWQVNLKLYKRKHLIPLIVLVNKAWLRKKKDKKKNTINTSVCLLWSKNSVTGIWRVCFKIHWGMSAFFFLFID